MIHGPALSVLIVAPGGKNNIAYVMSRLAEQSIAHRIEVLIAAHQDRLSDLVWTEHPFFAVRALSTDITTTARARAALIPKCRAPVISFLEDHSFPTKPDWAEWIVYSFEQSTHSAVGPAMQCANPAMPTSWANLYIDYGHWMHPGDPQISETLPGHNSSYRATDLSGFGPELADLLEAENLLHERLTQTGKTLLLSPDIQVSHINYSRLSHSWPMQFRNGQMFAASRAAQWPLPKRLAYALAAPAIMAVRSWRLWRQMRRGPDRPRAPRALPPAMVLLTASALGEGLGYAMGDTGKRHRLTEFELHRWDRLAPRDKAQFAITAGNLRPSSPQSRPS